MRKHLRQVATAFAVTLVCMLAGLSVTAQEIPKADNSIHDKLILLINKSNKVSLPAEVVQHIQSINQSNQNKRKAVYTQTTVLQVLYNTALSKSDRLFFGNHFLKNESPAIIAIRPDLQKLLANL